MGNEAMIAGLNLRSSTVEWKWEELKQSRPTPSLTAAWKLLEYLPFERLTYEDATKTTR